MSRAERLLAYVEATKGVPSTWGRNASDCSSWVARWIEQERSCRLNLPDYGDEAEGRKVVEEAGGLVNVWNGILGEAGMYSTGEPELGDVGIIQMTGHLTGCIFGKNGVVFLRGANGPAVLGARRWNVLAAYTV